MRRLILALLLSACGQYDYVPGRSYIDAGECKPVSTPQNNSCIVTFGIEDLSQLYLYCTQWNKGSWISPSDGIHYFYWCDTWVKLWPK